jgi:hypothetical protein
MCSVSIILSNRCMRYEVTTREIHIAYCQCNVRTQKFHIAICQRGVRTQNFQIAICQCDVRFQQTHVVYNTVSETR